MNLLGRKGCQWSYPLLDPEDTIVPCSGRVCKTDAPLRNAHRHCMIPYTLSFFLLVWKAGVNWEADAEDGSLAAEFTV